MPTALPTIADVATRPGTHGAVRAGLAALINNLAGLHGTDGTAATALATLGAMLARYSAKSAAYTATADDRGQLFDCSGTWALTLPLAATAGAGWAVIVRNGGAGTITLTRAGSDLIDGAATVALAAGRTAVIASTGTAWVTVQIVHGALAATLAGAETLTNKTLSLAANTVTMTKAQLNTAVTDGDPLYVGDSIPWTTVTGRPTTVAGYGITDASTLGGAQTITGAKTFTGGLTVNDSVFSIRDNLDITKVVQFEASGITTGTTRTITVPDVSGTLVVTAGTQTIGGAKTFSAGVTLSDGSAAAPAVSFTGGLTSGLYHAGTGTVGVSVNGAVSAVFGTALLDVRAATTELAKASIGAGRTGDGNSTLALVSDATLPGGGTLFTRYGGANGIAEIRHKGNGGFQYQLEGTGSWLIVQNGVETMRTTAAGSVGIGITGPSAPLHVNGAVRVGSYTVATVPSASTLGAGSIIYVSNEVGGGTIAFSDGTSWRRVADRAVIA